MDLHGKTAIVTGASSGIGAATASKLAEYGVKVAVVARRKELLEELAEEIKEAHGSALVIKADITHKQACQEVVNQVLKTWGSIDILVNNAGVMLLGPTA